MKALFLAGGKGTRLKPLTDHLPKPMVPIMGRPLLERSINGLERCGTNEIVLSTCYREDQIKKYFTANDGLKAKINYVSEDIPLGTGGAIKNCQKYFDDTFLIFNSDILMNIDCNDIIRYHKEKGADVTIAATYVPNPSSYGVIEYDSDGYAVTFTEKPKPGEERSNYINAGVYVFNPDVLELIPSGRVVSVEKETFPKILEKGLKIAVYRKDSYWLDIGTPEKYMKAHRDIFAGNCEIAENDFTKNNIYGFSNVKMHETSKVIGPVWFGKNVRLGANVTVGPNAVIGSGFQTGRGCNIRDSIIWDDVSIGSGVNIINSIVTAGCNIGTGIQCINTVYSHESKRHFAV